MRLDPVRRDAELALDRLPSSGGVAEAGFCACSIVGIRSSGDERRGPLRDARKLRA